MHDELWNISRLMKAPVEGIVLKGDNLNELVLAIRLVAEGNTYRSSAFDMRRREVLQTDGILSSKDIEVLRLLSAGQSNRDVAQEMGISEKTVEYHRANILKKLCSKTMLEATRRAVSLGIIRSAVTALFTLGSALFISASTSGPQPVDLGLSVLWADRNLNASSPEESGGFYAFAETFTKEVYNWTTYTHCDGSFELCHDLGTTDIAGSILDAASVQLSEGWRLPTAMELEELCANCRCEPYADTEAGAQVTMTAPNGSSINLPVCGYMSEGRVVYAGVNGTYLSSNCEFEVEEIPALGITCSILSPIYMAIVSNGTILPSMLGSAHLGMSIRPVKDRATSSTGTITVADRTVTSIHGLDGTSFGHDAAGLPRGIYIIVYSDGTTEKKIMR